MAPGTGEPLTLLENLIRRPDWQRYGACRGEDVQAFIPNLGGNFTKARELCRGCAVRSECLDFALADEDVIGMWGGTTAPETAADEGEKGSGVAVSIGGLGVEARCDYSGGVGPRSRIHRGTIRRRRHVAWTGRGESLLVRIRKIEERLATIEQYLGSPPPEAGTLEERLSDE